MVKPTHDLDGNPLLPPPKCKHCGKGKLDHQTKTYNCPAGRKHRTFGYPYFAKTVFETKESHAN